MSHAFPEPRNLGEFSPGGVEASLPCQHLDLRLLAARTVGQWMPIVLSALICGVLLA